MYLVQYVVTVLFKGLYISSCNRSSTAIKRRDLHQTQGGGGGGVYLKIGSFDPAFNRGQAFNREIMLMYKGLYGVCLLHLFASLGVQI